MTRNYIKFCPVCGSQNLDILSFGSDGHAQCRDCFTRFTVDAVTVKQKELKKEKEDPKKE